MSSADFIISGMKFSRILMSDECLAPLRAIDELAVGPHEIAFDHVVVEVVDRLLLVR